ncbi:3'-5' exonuclease, partial [Cutibacterium acnes]
RHPSGGAVRRRAPGFPADGSAELRVGRTTCAGPQLQAGDEGEPEQGDTGHDDDEHEARGVAERVAALVARGVPASEMAVLYRTNAQGEAFEQALAAAGVGYVVRGGERFFSRREVREAVALLRGAARGADPDTPMPQTVRDVLTGAGWSPTAPEARGAVRERWESL